MNKVYEFERPAIAVDCVVFGLDDAELKVMLIERAIEPFRGRWALPGGFVRIDETVKQAARRELQEETGLEKVYLEQFGIFDAAERDPRDRIISIAWYALVKMSDHKVQSATDAASADWFSVRALPELAFDHNSIIESALDCLRTRIRYEPVGFELLPAKFTLSKLQALYETILDRPLDKRNFRRKILSMDLLTDLNELETDVAHRAARLYRFQKSRYQQLVRNGFHFEI